MILLDTNVLSEILRPSPNPSVEQWLNAHFQQSAISAVSLLELLGGAAIMPPGKRRQALETAINRIVHRFAGRTYAFDEACARAAATLMARARTLGRGAHRLPEKLADLQLAGTAAAYNLALATRDASDFASFGLDLKNPWKPF